MILYFFEKNIYIKRRNIMAAYEELIKSGKINWEFNAISSDFGSKTGNDIKDHNEITDDEKLELKVLSQLDDLGFPLDELGTYLYKKVILGVIYYIKEVPEKNDPYYKELKEALKDKTSQFYFNLAKNDLDLPLNSFHVYIENAMTEMNQKKFNDASFDEIRNHEKDY